MGDDDQRFAQFAIENLENIEDFIGGLWRRDRRMGSSARRNAGSAAMARAMATLCSCPPESWRGVWSMRSARPTKSRAVSTCFRRSLRLSEVSKSGNSTFSNAVRTGDQIE